MSVVASQKNLETLIQSYNDQQKDYSQMITNRQTLDAQLKENEWVQKEFELLDAESRIYKLIGTALIKQEQDEARGNVKKRLEFIQREIKRSETQIKEMNTKLDKSKAEIFKMQTEISANQQ